MSSPKLSLMETSSSLPALIASKMFLDIVMML